VTEQPQQAPLDLVYTRALVVLRAGFRLAAVFLVSGITLALARGQELETTVDPFSEILPVIRDGHSRGFIDLAILTVMLTPLATVVTIGIALHQLGERRFARYSLAVLLILFASIGTSLIR
jgi:hypothetical protein